MNRLPNGTVAVGSPGSIARARAEAEDAAVGAATDAAQQKVLQERLSEIDQRKLDIKAAKQLALVEAAAKLAEHNRKINILADRWVADDAADAARTTITLHAKGQTIYSTFSGPGANRIRLLFDTVDLPTKWTIFDPKSTVLGDISRDNPGCKVIWNE